MTIELKPKGLGFKDDTAVKSLEAFKGSSMQLSPGIRASKIAAVQRC